MPRRGRLPTPQVQPLAPVTLGALSVSPATIAEGTAPGVVVGVILGRTSGSTLSLTDDAGGRFALSGSNIVTGLVATDYNAASAHPITISETLTGAANTPRSTTLTVTVTAVATAAPSLTSPVDSALGSTGANGSVDTDTANGTLFHVVSTSSTKPTPEQVEAGQMHTGAAAAYADGQTVSASGTQTLTPSPSGLTASTAYTIHFMHKSAAGVRSAVVSGDGFTTASAAFGGTAKTATFGQGTPAGAAGYRPYLSSGAADPLASYNTLLSGSLGPYTPSISSGRLVFSGTTGAPNGAVLRCTGTSGTLYDITISSPANCRAVKDQTEFNALTSSVYAVANSTLVLREGAGITWDTSGSTFGYRANLNGLTVEGEGPDPRLTEYEVAHQTRKHINYTYFRAIANVRFFNCLMTPSTKQTVFQLIETSGGGVTTDNIILDRCAVVASLPDPNGDYTAGAAGFPGNYGLSCSAQIAGIELLDTDFIGCLYGVFLHTSNWAVFKGVKVDIFYNDAIQVGGGSARAPVTFGGLYLARPMWKNGDAGGTSPDYLQCVGGDDNDVIEGVVMIQGGSRGTAQGIFLKDGATSWSALIRGCVSASDEPYIYTITRTDGSIIEESGWVPDMAEVLPSFTAGANRFGTEVATGTNYYRNNVGRLGGDDLAGAITSSGNYSLSGLNSAQVSALVTDRTFGVGPMPYALDGLPTMKQVIDGGRYIGAAAGKGSKMTLEAGVERSAYNYPVSAPVFSDVTVTRVSDTSATLSVKTTVPCNAIYWAAIPSGASVTDIEDIRRRRITGAHSYGWITVKAAETGVAKTATLTVPSAADYKVVFFQENGPTKPSAVQAQAFSTVSGGDVTAPTIASSSPADNATGVSITTSPTITFSENVQFGTGLITLRENNGGWADLETFDVATEVGTGNGQVSISGTVLTINPTASLTAGREYAIRIPATAIKDFAGTPNFFAGITNDTTLSFTAGTSGTNLITGPEAIATSPWLGGGGPFAVENTDTDPNGGATADRVAYSGGNGASNASWYQAVAIPGGTASKSLVFSIYLKSRTGGTQTVRIKNTHGGVIDDWSSDITVTTSWQRFEFARTNGASAGNGNQLVGLAPGLADAGFDVAASGAKLEIGTVASAYP